MANVFISYSHKDEAIKEKLEDHLSALVKKNVVSIWQDRLLLAGNEFDVEIKENISNADIILLLMSSNFMKSKYCSETELPIALEKHKQRTAIAIGVIVSPCQWRNTPIARYVSLPKDAKPITKHGHRDDAYLYIANAVEKRAHIRNRLNKKANLAFNKANEGYFRISSLMSFIPKYLVPFIAQHFRPIGVLLVVLFIIARLDNTEIPKIPPSYIAPYQVTHEDPYQTRYKIRTAHANFRYSPDISEDNIIRTISSDEYFWSFEQDRTGWWSAIDEYGNSGYIHGSTITK